MKELGNYLKKTRISNGVSITEACEDLDFSTSQLENIENGNVKAFKDVYELRDLIKQYAKYLGLNPDKVADEFNGFLFQHTSKISLDDIVAAQRKKNDSEEKISSPYTKEYKERIALWPIFYLIVGVLLLIGIIYLILSHTNKTPERVNELKKCVEEEYSYEFTY